jgi:biopolymer transport protein ExbD
MAGSQNQEENPVAINVVPMVDIIFCLCVFFMCSMKFKELEGKFDSWLPKDKGSDAPMTEKDLIEEIRVAMFWDDRAGQVVRQLGHRKVKNGQEGDQELEDLIREGHADHVKLNKPDTPVIIDADRRVPFGEVVNVMNLIKRNKIDKIEFAMGQQFLKKQ